MMHRIIGAIALWLALAASALAQSNPNLRQGQIPTAAQWNSYFAAKQDWLGTNPLLLTGGTMSGPLITVAPTTSSAGFRLPPGTAPTTPTNGDLWTTTAGVYAQINGSTVGPFIAGSSSITCAQLPALTGDITTSAGSCATSLTNAAVTYAKIQNIGALAVMGRSANSAGVGANISATAATDAVLRESGSVLGFGTIATGGIANNAVTLAKLATQTTNTVLGNATSGTAVPTALSMTSCSTAASAVTWTTNTGFGCNTSITAAAVPVGGITGLGTGVATALAVNVGSAGAFVTFNGALGTPSSGTATNLTGLPISTGLTGAGTGVLTALGVNVGTAGAFVVNGGALGSPSSAGTLPAFTLGGTISGGGNQINNVIIGAVTPLAGSFAGLTVTSSFTATGLVGNAALANSSMTIGGASTALGGTVTATTILDSISSTQGTVLYRNASSWVALAVGTAGQFLTTQGAGANPTWSSGGAGTGTVTSITPGSGLASTITATAPGSAITASGTLYGASLVNAQTGTTYAIVDGDRAKLITGTNAAAQAYSIAQAGASSAFQAGWFTDLKNLSTNVAGIITITPATSTINGAATFKLQPGRSVRIVSDGTNYQIAFSAEVAQIPSTTTNDDANAGNLGEYVNSTNTGSPVSLTTGTAANVTTISLTAGDWDVWGTTSFSGNAATTVTYIKAGISTTSATFSAIGNPGTSNTVVSVAGSTIYSILDMSVSVAPIRLSLSGTTTVYLLGQSAFAVNTSIAFGFISARRRR